MASGGSIDIWPPLVAPISSGAKAITGVWVQNFEPFAGEFGNSILFEKNVFVGHYPRPVWRFPLQTDKNALRPATGGGGPPWTASERLSSFVCRDNIAMVHPGPMTNWDGNIGFPGVDNDKWILYDPNSGPTWNARGNTTLTYDAAETGFDDRALKLYTRTGGPIAATAGTVATKRFVWPHGYIDRTDAHRGLS
jgi:hypothetical protein